MLNMFANRWKYVLKQAGNRFDKDVSATSHSVTHKSFLQSATLWGKDALPGTAPGSSESFNFNISHSILTHALII